MYKVNSQELTQIAHRYDLDLVVVFGSQVQGQARSGSDIDVAVRWIRRDWEDVERELALIGELTEAIWGDGALTSPSLTGQVLSCFSRWPVAACPFTRGGQETLPCFNLMLPVATMTRASSLISRPNT